MPVRHGKLDHHVCRYLNDVVFVLLLVLHRRSSNHYRSMIMMMMIRQLLYMVNRVKVVDHSTNHVLMNTTLLMLRLEIGYYIAMKHVVVEETERMH